LNQNNKAPEELKIGLDLTRVKNVALLKKQPAEIDNRVGLLSPHALALWESRKAHRRRRLVHFREAHTLRVFYSSENIIAAKLVA
jgi:hypothetical protein